jgi:lipoprotein-releasing system permease protein
MNFEWMVAVRYLRSPYKPAVLRLITALSVLGVAAGVATLVIALSVNTGFRQALQDRLLGATAHVNLTRNGSEGIRNYRALLQQYRGMEGVHSVTPALYQTVLLSGGSTARGILVKGVDPALERESNEVLQRIVQGDARFEADADGIEALLVGKLLASDLNLAVGDYVTLTSPQGRLTPFGMVPRTRRFRITGIFDSGFYDNDANWGFVTLPSAQLLAGVSDLAGVVEFRVTQIDQAEAIAQKVLQAAGPGFAVSTWSEMNQALFRALRLEKLVTAIFIGLITFVAGLNILVVLAMTVAEKSRDIAVLMSLGARARQVRNIFVWQGLVVGGFGTFAGLVLGYSIAWVADRFQLIQLDPEVYAIPYVPFHASWFDALWIVAATLAVSAAATLFPARAAARILPVEILRYE